MKVPAKPFVLRKAMIHRTYLQRDVCIKIRLFRPLLHGRIMRLVSFRNRALVGSILLIAVAGTLRAQDALGDPPAAGIGVGGPSDWSNRHVIYTLNGSAHDMDKLRDDPRFLQSIFSHYMNEHRDPFGSDRRELSVLKDGGRVASRMIEERPQPGEFPIRGPWETLGHLPSPTPTPIRAKNSKVDWSMSLGPTAGMALGESPSVYTYNYSSPSCSDFVVYTINAAPSVGGQANLIAFDNLYSNGAATGYCSGTGPSVLFSYAIGSGGSPLSPVLSLNGTKVAWIEDTSSASFLHITNWVANDGISATYPIAPSGTFSNGSCTPSGSSCDDSIEYTASTYPGCSTAYTAPNGHSDLFIDYTNNAGYISANNGLLYHISNIFSATASPTVDFCIPVNAGFETSNSSAMSGPVYDPVLNEVFISDSEKMYGFKVNASSFSAASPASYTFGNSGSNYNYPTGPGPLLDQFNGYLYVPSTYDASSKTSVTQIPTSLASGVEVPLGPKNTNTYPYLFYGAFDNNYYNNGPKSSASTLYSCGTDSTTTTVQDLFSISFNASTGIANTTPAMSNNKNINPGGNAGVCSPLTEFYDGTNDRLFVGMGQPGASTGANVVTMWNVNTQLTNTSGSGGTMPTYTAEATGYLGGASGISADNNANATAQAENIYFSTEDPGVASTNAAGNGYNVYGIYTNGTTFGTGGFDGDGYAYSYSQLGASQTWNGTTFSFGSANVPDCWSNTTITLPSGSYNTLEILAAAVNGNQTGQTFTLNYSDGTTSTFTQSLSDWYSGTLGYVNESVAVTMSYENAANGGERVHPTFVYGYSYGINPNKTVSSLTLPANRNVVVMAVALATNCGGKDYCAVKLTQTGLQ